MPYNKLDDFMNRGCVIYCKRHNEYVYKYTNSDRWIYSVKKKISECAGLECPECEHSFCCTKMSEACNTCNLKFLCAFILDV